MAGRILNRSALLRFAAALFVTNLKATTMLRGAFVTQVVFMALNNATFFVFWWALMARVPVLHGWRLADIQVLFGIVATAFGVAVLGAGGVRHLGRLIDEGELDTLLTQPKPALLPNLPGWVCVCSFADARFDLPFQTLVDPVCLPPTIGSLSASPSKLWPANHRMVDVTLHYDVAGTCPASCALNVASSDAPDGVGDGNTAPDWTVVDPYRVRLRAERAGNRAGRIYTITVACTSSTGQLSLRNVVVTVPHDAGR